MKILSAYELRKRHLFIIFTLLFIILFALWAIPPGEHDLYPGKIKTGRKHAGYAAPLYYTGRTKVVAGPGGAVKKVHINYAGDEVEGEVTLYLMVDTYPAASATVIL